MQRITASFLVGLLTLFVCSICRGDGFIIIDNPPHRIPGHFSFAPLEVTYHHVDVAIDDGVARTSVDQEFYNSNNSSMEGTYIFPLPLGAHIDKFELEINGKMTEAELLDANKARAIYEEIVRKQKDPGLLEYAGRDAFKVRVFPIEPHSHKKIAIKYTQVLTPDAGLVEYVYSLNTEKFSSKPLKDVAIKVDLKSSDAIKSIYSPSHNVEVRQESGKHAVVGFEARDVRPDSDFKLIYSCKSDDPVAMHLLTNRRGGEDGYFLLMASPGVDVAKGKIQPKDICFVIDTSGSMAGAKMEQAKKALNFCLANLNEGDRFNVIRFSTDVEPLFDQINDATKENVSKAREFVNQMKSTGGTDIADALTKAIDGEKNRRMAGEDRPYVVVFLTDGLPTVGKTGEDDIVSIASAPSHDKAGIRVFTFGIGTDVNTHLLDRIANDTKAASQYVLPEEDIEVKVSSFYTKIQSPVLTDVKVAIAGGDVKLEQMYPRALPDLFKGQTLLAFGRYGGNANDATITLTGKLNGEEKTFTSKVNFPKAEASHDFIPRLWATRRVGWLLDEIRLRGESAELKDEVTQLSRQYGIVTPYTAYLIMEDEQKRKVPIALQSFRELHDDTVAAKTVHEYYDSAQRQSAQLERSGQRAVQNSTVANQLKFGQNESEMLTTGGMTKSVAASSPALGAAGYRFAQNYSQQSRVINGRAFYQNGEIWTDASAQNKSAKQQQIKFSSDEYFTLLKDHPEVAPWFALGSDIDLVLDDTVYQIRSGS